MPAVQTGHGERKQTAENTETAHKTNRDFIDSRYNSGLRNHRDYREHRGDCPEWPECFTISFIFLQLVLQDSFGVHWSEPDCRLQLTPAHSENGLEWHVAHSKRLNYLLQPLRPSGSCGSDSWLAS
jgi:hypothetical protein